MKNRPYTYEELVTTGAKLSIAVRVFPSDVLLAAVRKIAEVCKENEGKNITGGGDPATTKVCADTAEKRALIEETAKALTAARVLIENAMNQYAEAAKEFSGEKAEKSGLFVPANAGKVVLTD